MPVLKDEVKLFITQCLACYDAPSQVVDAVKEEFNIVLERSHVQSYDPYKRQGRDLSVKFKVVFDETRKAFLEDISKIPIASQSFRLRSLQRSYDYFVSKKNYVAANQVLEQAAKEVGNFYTNRIKLGGDVDNPLMLFAQQITGGSLPVVEDVEGEFEIVPEATANIDKPKPLKKPVWKSK